MASTIRNITIVCAQPWELAQFWSSVLDRPVLDNDKPDADEVGIPLDGITGELLFTRAPEDTVIQNRMHLCLEPDYGQDAEIDRLVQLGASLVSDLRGPTWGWAVLRDPEGNEFCVLRSEAERAASSAVS